jgi:nitroreductase
MDAIEVLKTRRSIRAYEDKPVDKAVIEDIVDCARLAASAMNYQPWEFIVVTDLQARKELSEIAAHGRFIAEAPVCIITVCQDGEYAVLDGCAATQNILLAAKAHGLGSCWVAGVGKAYAQDVLTAIGVPAGYTLISLVAIGYSNQTPKPPKRQLSEVIHWDKF